MINLFNLWEIEENKIVRFILLLLIVGCTLVGSVMIVMSLDAIGFYNDRSVGLVMLLVGIVIGLSPSYKIYREEENSRRIFTIN